MKRGAEPDYSDIGSPVSGPFIRDDLPGGDPAYPKERSHEEAMAEWEDEGGYATRDWAFTFLVVYSVVVTLALLQVVI